MFRDVFGWMISGDNTEIVYIHDLSVLRQMIAEFSSSLSMMCKEWMNGI